MTTIIEQVILLSNNFTNIINRDILRNYEKLNWGDNGIGSRWLNSKFNYTVIYANKKTKLYSENDDDIISEQVLLNFLTNNKNKKGIIGIFVHSIRHNIIRRPIKKEIENEIKKMSCICCGSKSEIICDHKNDIYNDENVLCIKTQKLEDFQALCNHCNLQKRQIFKEEVVNNKIYSAKNILPYQMYNFEFPWEKKIFDKKDVNTKKDTYWYDPIEFNNKIYKYMMYVLPVVNEIKRRNKL